MTERITICNEELDKKYLQDLEKACSLIMETMVTNNVSKELIFNALLTLLFDFIDLSKIERETCKQMFNKIVDDFYSVKDLPKLSKY